MNTAIKKAMGIVFFAGQRKPTNKIPAANMGKKASKACNAVFSAKLISI
jgi:hypothetical protein